MFPPVVGCHYWHVWWFLYVFSSSDEPEVVNFNRNVLPAYYGLLRLCCEHSRSFTHQLAVHSNMKWAFENLTIRMNQYPQVCTRLSRAFFLRMFSLTCPFFAQYGIVGIISHYTLAVLRISSPPFWLAGKAGNKECAANLCFLSAMRQCELLDKCFRLPVS